MVLLLAKRAGVSNRCQNEKYTFSCRGQVTPGSKLIIYEIFIDEIINEPVPTIFPCTGDGGRTKSHGLRKIGIALVPEPDRIKRMSSMENLRKKLFRPTRKEI